MKTKLIIDTDPGIDDAMAIFYALASPRIDLLGLTSIFGNVHTWQATRNALALLDWAGAGHVPVAEGQSVPRVLPPFAPSARVHGDEGFGDTPAHTSALKPVSEAAPDFLVRMARAHKGELVLCPIGPLTNIAAAMDLDPEFATNVARIVIMGGSLEEGGNVTEHAEANIYHDPHAADRVFASGAAVTLVGLDVTHQILCSAEDFAAIGANAPKLGGMIEQMSKFYLDFYLSVGKMGGCSLHDPAAVIACTHPEFFTPRAVPLGVICEGGASGATIKADDDRAPIDVLMQTDAAAVRREFLETMFTLD